MTEQPFPLEPQPDRDRYGRPMVIPVGGGKAKSYRRCTTFVGVLDDTFKLGQWQQRKVAEGLAQRPDLLLAVSAHRDEKDTLNTVCDAAREQAQASAAATTGTALHALTERLDRGEEMGHVPQVAVADLEAYADATRDLTALHIERFMVEDELGVGGTPDRIVEYEGRRYIADLKTGSVDFAALKIAMQLAVYAHSHLYDVNSGHRSAVEGLDKDRALVIHLPAGSGTARLLWADIAAGWEAAQVARQVWEWRKRGRSMLEPLTAALGVADDPALPIADGLDMLREQITEASTPETLVVLWQANAQRWTPELTELAVARKAQLV